MGNLETIEKKERADVNADGKITKEDLDLIIQKVENSSVIFPAENLSQKTLKIGDTVTLSVKTEPTVSAAPIWTISDSNIAQIDQTGKLIAKSKGETVITVAIGGMTKYLKITVE